MSLIKMTVCNVNGTTKSIPESGSQTDQSSSRTDSASEGQDLTGTVVAAYKKENSQYCYAFYATTLLGSTEQTHVVQLTMPVGGQYGGLFHFPRVGEVILAETLNTNSSEYYLVAYLPSKEIPFGDFGADINKDQTRQSDALTESSTLLRYQKSGSKPAGPGFDELGFVHHKDATSFLATKLYDGSAYNFLESLILCDTYNSSRMNHLIRLKTTILGKKNWNGPASGATGNDAATPMEYAATLYADNDLGISTHLSQYLGTGLRLNSNGTLTGNAVHAVDLHSDTTVHLSTGDAANSKHTAHVLMDNEGNLLLHAEKKIILSVGAQTISLTNNGINMTAASLQGYTNAMSPIFASIDMNNVKGVSISGMAASVNGFFSSSVSDGCGGMLSVSNGNLSGTGGKFEFATANTVSYGWNLINTIAKLIGNAVKLSINSPSDQKIYASNLNVGLGTVSQAVTLYNRIAGYCAMGKKGFANPEMSVKSVLSIIETLTALVLFILDQVYVELMRYFDAGTERDNQKLDYLGMGIEIMKLTFWAECVIEGMILLCMQAPVSLYRSASLSAQAGKFTVIAHDSNELAMAKTIANSPFAGVGGEDQNNAEDVEPEHDVVEPEHEAVEPEHEAVEPLHEAVPQHEDQ